MAQVRAADYSVFLKEGAFADRSAPDLLSALLREQEIIVHKVTKKTESDVDIRPLIFEAEVMTGEHSLFIHRVDEMCRIPKEDPSYEQEYLAAQTSERIRAEGYPVVIDMKLSAGSAANLKPETVIEAMCTHANLPYDPFSFLILRREMYMEGGKTLLDEGLLF